MSSAVKWVLFVRCADGTNRVAGQIHVQFFGHEREHGWVGDKWLMAYEGLAAFEAEAERNASMKVNPRRRAAWAVAVNDAEQVVGVDRQKRIPLLAAMYKSCVPHTNVSSPRKQKRPYQQKGARTSSAAEDRNSLNASAVSPDEDASPPRKKFCRRSSLPMQRESGGPTVGDVLSSAAECDIKDAVSTGESCSTAEKNSDGKLVCGLSICGFCAFGKVFLTVNKLWTELS